MDEQTSILVVDDEASLRKLMEAYLGRLGYQVTSCEDAQSGLELLRANPGAFRVVIADLTLPDMPGSEMAAQMLAMNPELSVLICSGYLFDPETMPPYTHGRVGMLQKPFLPDMLRTAIRDLLAR